MKGDERLGSSPWLLLVGVLVGSAAASLHAARLLRAYRRLDDQDEEGSTQESSSTPHDETMKR